mgnify:CR=1 FL=1
MKKILLCLAIAMATIFSVKADNTKCDFSLYVESDNESDNLNEDLTFEMWQTLAAINVRFNTAAHRADNEQGIFYVGDEIHISVYGFLYSFAGWSDDWTSGDKDFDWNRDITLTGDLSLGIIVNTLPLKIEALSNDDNLGTTLSSFFINNNSQETFKGTDLLNKCDISFYAEPKEGCTFLGWISDITYQQMLNDLSDEDFKEWVSETIKSYEESQTSDDYTQEMKEINLMLKSTYIQLDNNDLMNLNSNIQLYDNKTGRFALRAIFKGETDAGVTTCSQTVNSVQKVLRNGQLLINRNGKTYNALGAEMR